MVEKFVPIDDLAEQFTVSSSTIRAWVRSGHIPKHLYIKVGNTYRFQVHAIVAALSGMGSTEDVAAEGYSAEVDFNLDLDDDARSTQCQE
jgi:excisionase family DNA binding protein